MSFSGNFTRPEIQQIPDSSFDPILLLKHLLDHKIISLSAQDQSSLFGSNNTEPSLVISPQTFNSENIGTQLPETIKKFEAIIRRIKIEDYGAFLNFNGNLFAPTAQTNFDYQQIISNYFILKILERINNQILFNLSKEDTLYLVNFQQTVAALGEQDQQFLNTSNVLPNILSLAKRMSDTRIPTPLSLEALSALPSGSVVVINPYVLDSSYVLEANMIQMLSIKNSLMGPAQIYMHADDSMPASSIKAGVVYPFTLRDQDKTITIKIMFTNSLALYTNSANSVRYTILEDTLGKGNYGEAVHAAKALAFNKNGTLRVKKSHYDYVTKIIKNVHEGHPRDTQEEKNKINNKFIENIMQEHILGRKLSHLHIKAKPVFIYDKNGYISECQITMRRLKGVSLSEYMKKMDILTHKPYKKINEYTKEEVEKLLDQSINLIRALKRVHNVQIIHRDIKPENIMIDPDTNKFYFFDVGLSKEKGTIYRENTGTPINLTPEQITQYLQANTQRGFVYQNVTNESTDYWEFAFTLAQLWGMGHFFGHHNDRQILFQDVLHTKKDKYDKGQTLHLMDLNADHREKLLYIINELLRHNPGDRVLAWQEAQNMLEAIRLGRCAPEAKAAHELARELRHKLDTIELKRGKHSDLSKVLEEIQQVCLNSDLLNQPSALKEFNRVLGIKQLSKFTNKTDFQNHVNLMLEKLKLAENIAVMMSELAAQPLSLPNGGRTQLIVQQLQQVYRKLSKTDSTLGKVLRITTDLTYPSLSQFYDLHVLHRELQAINPVSHPTFHAYLTELLERNLKVVLIETPNEKLFTALDLPIIRDYIVDHPEFFQETSELKQKLVDLLVATHEKLSTELSLNLTIPDSLLRDENFLRELCKREMEIQSLKLQGSNIDQATTSGKKADLEAELKFYITHYHENRGANFSSSLFAKQTSVPVTEKGDAQVESPLDLPNTSGRSTI